MKNDSAVFLLPEKARLNGLQVRFDIRRRNFRQKQVARRLRLSESQFCQLLDGKYLAPSEIIAALSAILRVPQSSIVIRNGGRHEK